MKTISEMSAAELDDLGREILATIDKFKELQRELGHTASAIANRHDELKANGPPAEHVERIGEFPPGRYFVGDPCYVIDPDNEKHINAWDAFCECDDRDATGTAYVVDGITMGSVYTEYGDGQYDGFYVDSSTLGAASIDHLDEAAITDLAKYGRIVTFNRSFTVSSHGSKVTIGDIEIETGDVDAY